MAEPAETRRIGRRWHVPVDPAEADAGDVVEYFEAGTRARRTHRVAARVRHGKEPAVQVQLHPHEGGIRRVPLVDVARCWRRRAAA